MDLAVFVESLDPETFRASIAQPITLESIGSTKEAAINQIRELAQQRLRSGEWVNVQLPTETAASSLLPLVGIWKDHPDFEQYLANIEEYRRRADEAEQLQ